MLTRFLSARFLLPFVQLPETLAKFLPAQVTMETDRKRGPGKSQHRAGDTVRGGEESTSFFLAASQWL